MSKFRCLTSSDIYSWEATAPGIDLLTVLATLHCNGPMHVEAGTADQSGIPAAGPRSVVLFECMNEVGTPCFAFRF